MVKYYLSQFFLKMSLFGFLKKNKEEKQSHSFCETVFASSNSPWHIRELTEKGKMLGGGADTESLCGLKVSWDLDVKITEQHLSHCCKHCMKKFKEIKDESKKYSNRC